MAYGGEIQNGEHAPIVERKPFDADQARLRERSIRRIIRRSRSPCPFLEGDSRRPRQSDEPERRQREKYAQSLLCLAGHPGELKFKAYSVCRVSGPNIETIVIDAIHQNVGTFGCDVSMDLIDDVLTSPIPAIPIAAISKHGRGRFPSVDSESRAGDAHHRFIVLKASKPEMTSKSSSSIPLWRKR